VIAAVILAAHFSSFDAFRQPIVTDIRYYLYFAARVARGDVPHRDYFDIKMQLASFAGALLFRTGEALGLDPLYVIRIGYLILAGLVGMLIFATFRRLSGLDGAGIAGVLAYTGFGLLGVLPSIGNIPKMLVVVFAYLAAFLALRRRWFLAGLAGVAAFCDWQIGGIVWLGVAAASVMERDRWRALGLAVLGGAAGMAAVMLYFGLNGALGAAISQALVAAHARGAASFARETFVDRCTRIGRLVDSTGAGRLWLIGCGSLGMCIVPAWVWRERGSERRRLIVPLAVYHGTIVLFSLLDFQRFGDLFILLHSIAFFSGAALAEGYARLHEFLARGALRPGGAAGLRRAIPIAALVALGLAVRPSFLRPPVRIGPRGLTLDDQRTVAASLRPLVAGKRLAFLGSTEQLFLLDARNEVPINFWEAGARSYFVEAGESSQRALARILRTSEADVLILPRGVDPGRRLHGDYRRIAIAAPSGRYKVILFAR